MNEGKTSKYLKYAVGEIFLVVIGILIALQINNCNESRLERKEEIKVLEEIKNALNHDFYNTISPLKNRAFSRRELTTRTMEAIKAGKRLNDTLNYIFLMGGETFRPSYTAYKSLESKGIDLIRNDSIKYGITQIYDFDYVHLTNRLEQNNFANLRDFIRPFMYDNFYLDENEKLSPLKPELLLDSHMFKMILYKTKGSDEATIRQLSDIESQIQKVIHQIDNEIQER